MEDLILFVTSQQLIRSCSPCVCPFSNRETVGKNTLICTVFGKPSKECEQHRILPDVEEFC